MLLFNRLSYILLKKPKVRANEPLIGSSEQWYKGTVSVIKQKVLLQQHINRRVETTDHDSLTFDHTHVPLHG